MTPWPFGRSLPHPHAVRPGQGFRVIPVNERVAFRAHIDFFNVFNIPGIRKTPNLTTGLIDAQFSGNGARSLQFGLRLSW